MRTVVLEIRDRATFIPALAVGMSPWSDHHEFQDAAVYLLRRAGYGMRQRLDSPAYYDPAGRTRVLLTRLCGGSRAESDPTAWADRTWKTAHSWIAENWDRYDRVYDGAVVDVEYILGEKLAPSLSERADDAARLGPLDLLY